jgi:hypothetical protein
MLDVVERIDRQRVQQKSARIDGRTLRVGDLKIPCRSRHRGAHRKAREIRRR